MGKEQPKPEPGATKGIRPILPAEGDAGLADQGPRAPDGPTSDSESVLLFEIGADSFAIGVEHTDGVVDCPRVSPLPDAPDGFIGVASVRGRMTLVVDLSLAAGAGESKRRLVLLKGEAQLGLLVDRVEGVVALPRGENAGRKSSPKGRAGVRAACRWPVVTYLMNAGRDVPVIDVGALAEI